MQAYGWGLYFAEKEEVAEWYVNTFQSQQAYLSVVVDGQDFEPHSDYILDMLGKYEGNLDFVEEDLRKELSAPSIDRFANNIATTTDIEEFKAETWSGIGRDITANWGNIEESGIVQYAEGEYTIDLVDQSTGRKFQVEINEDEETWSLCDLDNEHEYINSSIHDMGHAKTEIVNWQNKELRFWQALRQVQYLKENKATIKYTPGTTSLYKVGLAPSINEYLDWDKPLSEQPKSVLERLGNIVDLIRKEEQYREGLSEIKGYGVYGFISKMEGGDREASEYLASIGIPGLRYLDGESRQDGEGTYNYVVFDD